MEYRVLGRTGLEASYVALSSLSVVELEPAESNRFILDALARGVTYLDVAPTYADGEAERRLGRVLPAHRDEVILACKTQKRTAPEAQEALAASLRQLRTDRFDVYQLHMVDSEQDLETVLGPGGALEALQRAVEAGTVRFIGITSHNHRLLAQAVQRFPFATALTPVNYALRERCLPALEVLDGLGMGVIAIKATAHRLWRETEKKDGPERRAFPYCWYRPLADAEAVSRAVGWTLAQKVTTAVPPASARVARLVLEAAETGFTSPDLSALERLKLEPIFA